MIKFDKLSSAGAVINQLFDPTTASTSKTAIAKELKYFYQLQQLRLHWQEICGPSLAKSCSPVKIENSLLYVNTESSIMANELYMIKYVFLNKLNKVLAGKIHLKDLRFHVGPVAPPLTKPKEPKYTPVKITRCLLCGARKAGTEPLCIVCQREERAALRRKIKDQLRYQPWATYEDLARYFPGEELLFRQVKEELKSYYYELVRQDQASPVQAITAVMLLTGKRPEQLTESSFQNSLKFLRRDAYVPAFRRGLYGKK